MSITTHDSNILNETNKVIKEPTKAYINNSSIIIYTIIYIASYFLITSLFDSDIGLFIQIKQFLFIAAYIFSVEFIAIKQKIKRTKESIFWLTLLTLSSLSVFIPYENDLSVMHGLVIIFNMIYWTAIYFKQLYKPHTSHFYLIDLFHIFIKTYGINLNIYTDLTSATLSHLKPKNNLLQKSKPFLLGLGMTGLFLFIIVPLLIGADNSGVFSAMITESIPNLFSSFSFFQGNFKTIFISLFLACILTSYFITILISLVDENNVIEYRKSISEINFAKRYIFHPTSILTVNFVIISLYFIFLKLQADYFFSAFVGILPEDHIYSSYARQGFFELCIISIMNFILLLLTNELTQITTKVQRISVLTVNILLAVVTILLIMIALSKMLLYINEYDLTVKRVLVCIILFYFTIIWFLFIFKQFFNIPMARIAVYLGGALFTITCLSHLNILIAISPY